MDSTDLRAGLAERLASADPVDAVTFNTACFVLSKALDELPLSVPQAAPLVRTALRVAGRVVIDTGLPDSAPDAWPNTQQMAVEWMAAALSALGYRVSPSGEVEEGSR